MERLLLGATDYRTLHITHPYELRLYSNRNWLLLEFEQIFLSNKVLISIFQEERTLSDTDSKLIDIIHIDYVLHNPMVQAIMDFSIAILHQKEKDLNTMFIIRIETWKQLLNRCIHVRLSHNVQLTQKHQLNIIIPSPLLWFKSLTSRNIDPIPHISLGVLDP